MRVLVTGSSGHLGEGMVRVLSGECDVVGLDLLEAPQTSRVGSVLDRSFVRACLRGVDAVVHTATLHKPHLVTHDREDFVRTNIEGTLIVLEEAADAGVGAFVYSSTTSVFGRALTPPTGAPAAWITEDVAPSPRNIYGATKAAAEELCEIVHRERDLPTLVLRVARFFPEHDDNEDVAASYPDLNVKVNELLHRRVDLDDAVQAHRLAVVRAPQLGFGRYVVSATTPFSPGDLDTLRSDAPKVVERLFPDYQALYAARGWRMFPSIDRVYVNTRARTELGWKPRYDFRHALDSLGRGEDPRSPLAVSIGAKGYHTESASTPHAGNGPG